MAAIDPSAEPEFEDADDKQKPRATLKVVRIPDDMFDSDDDEESDDEDYADLLGDDESDDDEEANGGPSDRKAKKLALLEALAADEDDDEDEDMEDDNEDGDDDDDDDEADAKAIAQLKKLMKSSKGKGKAIDGEESDDDESEEDESLEMDEVVICTLDPEKVGVPSLTEPVHTNSHPRTTNKPWTSLLAKVKKSFSKSPAPTLST
jgi:FK506-binding nuclear protein